MNKRDERRTFVIMKRKRHPAWLILSAVFLLLPLIPGLLDGSVWLWLTVVTAWPFLLLLYERLYLSRIVITIDAQKTVIHTPLKDREYRRGTLYWKGVRFGVRGGCWVHLVYQGSTVFRFLDPDSWDQIRSVALLHHTDTYTDTEKQLLRSWR